MSRQPLNPAGCTTCRSLPDAPPEIGTLYLGPPAAEPLARLQNFLRDEGVPYTRPIPGVLAVDLAAGLLTRLAGGLTAALTETEIQSTRALVLPPGATPTLADFMTTQPLGTLLAAVRYRWLVDVMRDERLTTHFQPIVLADDPGAVFGHECLLRGLDPAGKMIPPLDLFAAARAANLLFPLDRQARMTAIRSAVRHGLGQGDDRLFLNFNPSAIYTPSFCLRTTFKAVEEAGLHPGRIVFEVVESEEVRDTGHLLHILEEYRKAGFGVALDDVGAGYSSLNLLARLRPDYVKVDMGLVRNVDRDPYKAAVVGRLLEMARDVGVKTILEGVETTGEWEWCRDHGADFVQGYLFARPACPPLAPRVPATAVAVG